MSLWTDFRDSAENSVGLGNGGPSADDLARQAGAALAGSALQAGASALNPPAVPAQHPATAGIVAGVAKPAISMTVVIGIAVLAFFVLKGRK